MRKRCFTPCFSVLLLCAIYYCLSAGAAVYHVSNYRWFSQWGINEHIRWGELTQWSHCRADGWTTASENCLKRFWGAWNGLSKYRIDPDPGFFAPVVDWGVGPTGDPTHVAWAYTAYNPNGLTYIDQYGRTVKEPPTVWVVFDEGKRWRDEYGNLQPAVRNYQGNPTYFRIDFVTVHEAGHVYGCNGHSSYTTNVMHRNYPHNYGVISQDDRDTIRDLYNVRLFRKL
jgi:hypothetical protein